MFAGLAGDIRINPTEMVGFQYWWGKLTCQTALNVPYSPAAGALLRNNGIPFSAQTFKRFCAGLAANVGSPTLPRIGQFIPFAESNPCPQRQAARKAGRSRMMCGEYLALAENMAHNLR